MKTQDITYRDGDLTLNGFLAYDETLTGTRPGVLVVHEAWGLGDHAMERARMLAGLGYVAFAADMFGGRRQINDLQEAMGLLGDLRGNPAKLRGRAKAALDVLAAQPQVDGKRLGGIGFCFGGTTVLELARGGHDLAAVVSFHGGLDTAAPAQKGAVKAKVLVCTGGEDPMIPDSQISAFQDEMRAAGADWQVITYGGAKHSFTNPGARSDLIQGVEYHKPTDQRSWAAMKAHFAEAFGG
jgi:dienelactone hydrolase